MQYVFSYFFATIVYDIMLAPKQITEWDSPPHSLMSLFNSSIVAPWSCISIKQTFVSE